MATGTSPLIIAIQSLRHGAFQIGRRDIHEHHELLCVTQGSYAVTTEAGDWQGGPGDVFCYPAETGHDVHLDPREESHFLIVNWLQEPSPLIGPRRVHDRQGRILATMLWMFDRWPTEAPATHRMLAGLLTALLHEIDLLASANLQVTYDTRRFAKGDIGAPRGYPKPTPLPSWALYASMVDGLTAEDCTFIHTGSPDVDRIFLTACDRVDGLGNTASE